MRKVLNTTGDTIIEVMIALSVLAAVLGGAYVSANRSLNMTRQAQERTESLKVTEDQLEKLKAAYNAGIAIPQAGTFCISDALGVVADAVMNQAQCSKSPSGGVSYRYQIEYEANAYKLTTTWDRISGGGIETLVMRYRL